MLDTCSLRVLFNLVFYYKWRDGVLKNKGNSILWGSDGAIDLLFLGRLKFLTSFSSANEPPTLNERFTDDW